MKKIIIILLTMILLSLNFALADTCTETDSGDDPLVSGTVSFVNGTTTTYTDSCSTSSRGYASCTEYYCSGTSYLQKQYYCDSITPTACDTSYTSSTSYIETDSGNYPLIGGKVVKNITYILSFNSYSSSTDYKDYCITAGSYSGYLYEYYLSSTTKSTSKKYSCSSTYGSSYSCMIDTNGYGYCGIACTSDSDCASGYVCTDGACVEEPLVEVCDDGTDNDEDESVDCADSDCSADEVCIVIDTTTTPIGCIETDSGYDIYTLGTTTSDLGSAGMPAGSYTDTCSGSNLIEYACPTNGSSVVDYYNLACSTDYTCTDGACVSTKTACTMDSECSGYECAADGYCTKTCTADYECDQDSGYTCSDTICLKFESEPEIISEICNDGIDNDVDSTIDLGGLDTDSDGNLEYTSGCVRGTVFVKYGDSTITCPRKATYQCQDISTRTIATCPTGNYIAQDTDCVTTTASRAAEIEEEIFFVKLWRWIVGAS